MKVFIMWTLVLLILFDLKIIQGESSSETSSTTNQTKLTTATPSMDSSSTVYLPLSSISNTVTDLPLSSISNTVTDLPLSSISNTVTDSIITTPISNLPSSSISNTVTDSIITNPISNLPLSSISNTVTNLPLSSISNTVTDSIITTPISNLPLSSISNPVTENAEQILRPKIKPPKEAIKIKFELAINDTFNLALKQRNSTEYAKACGTYGKTLQQKFRDETGVKNLNVTVTGFMKGSVIVQYEVIVPFLNTSVTYIALLDKKLENAAINWTNYKQNFTVDIGKTEKRAIKNTFLQTMCDCGRDDYVCVSEQTSLRCEHKCNNSRTKISCQNHGHCVYDRDSKKQMCLCNYTESEIFYGEYCQNSMIKTNSTTTTTNKIPTTPDPFPVSKLTIIAISGGTGGALLLIILISTICFCYRLKHTKRKGSFSDTSSKCDSDIIRDNKKMESIPLESGRLNPGYRDDRQESGRRYHLEQPQTTKSNPLYRDDYGDQRKGYQTDPEPRYQDHDRISRGSFNPQTSNDRLRTESSGNRQPVKQDQRESENSYRPRGISSERNNGRVWPEEISRDRNNSNDRYYPKGRSEESSIGDDRYVYIEGDGGVRRLFKRVDDKDLGGETLIYQPSNMPRPIQRENVDSVGDNFIMRPAPPQDNERRSSFYDTIDSENPYKIKRPNIKHNNLYS